MSVFDKLIINRASHLTAEGTPEHQLIATLRKALKDYDRATKVDGRRNNGNKRVDPTLVQRAVAMVKRGISIRRAARDTCISFTTLWTALQKAE